MIFVGQNQKSLPVELVKRLLEHQGMVEIYESAGTGKNALDFQLAFYAGRVFEREPEIFVHIVSRDKRFDQLVTHIRSQGRECSRVDNCECEDKQPGPALFSTARSSGLPPARPPWPSPLLFLRRPDLFQKHIRDQAFPVVNSRSSHR